MTDYRISFLKENFLMKDIEELKVFDKNLNGIGFETETHIDSTYYDMVEYAITVKLNDIRKYDSLIQPLLKQFSCHKLSDAFIIVKAMYPQQYEEKDGSIKCDTVTDFECIKDGDIVEDYRLKILDVNEFHPKYLRCNQDENGIHLHRQGDKILSYYQFDFDLYVKINEDFKKIKPIKFTYSYISHEVEKKPYNLFMDKIVPKPLFEDGFEPSLVKEWKDKYDKHTVNYNEKEMEGVEIDDR